MSAMDVTCKRQSEFGINMPLLIRSFDPELIGALWEGKIAEDHTGIKEQYPEVFSAIMPKSLLETAGNTEQTAEAGTTQIPSAKKKRGKKSTGQTEPEGQLSLNLEEEHRKQMPYFGSAAVDAHSRPSRNWNRPKLPSHRKRK